MNVVLVIAGVLLVAAAIITTYRLLDGPSTLDRLVAMDSILAVSMCGLALWSVYSLDTTIVPAIVALSLVSFIGSVSVARFRVRDE
ncbi:monovalent cation/H+ antiporter complex subunit F [Rhodococcus sp. 1168]|uniref:monovalent cation/H+ antiporter complex subunit F n=1 Tax=Rhodococcus sp. 1168 TaxID=2018041 RepID=UPI000A0E7E72|nr:monovalent cation/H+ antiporter complex subunit F [Rhodococcus sp. 1168]ORI21399.1 cation:proton antiporter [Rhodococcus sp. 1168]